MDAREVVSGERVETRSSLDAKPRLRAAGLPRLSLVSPTRPLGQQQRFQIQAQQLVDAVLLAAALVGAYFVRTMLGDASYLPEAAPIRTYLPFALIAALIGPFTLSQCGVYRSGLAGRVSPWTIAKGIGILVLLLLAFGYLAQEPSPSRVVTGAFTAAAILLIWTRQTLWQRFTHSASAHHNVALVGASVQNQALRTLIDAHPKWGITIAGSLESSGDLSAPLLRLLHEHHVDTVIVTGARTSFDKIDELVQLCETEGVDVWLFANFVTTAISRMSFDQFHGQPMVRFQAKPDHAWALAVKRGIDLVIATFALLVAGPLVMLPTALAIRLSSPGPVLFRQNRCGKHGRTFHMYKFRSMVADAESRRDALEVHNEQSGPVFKIAKDPRVTRLGSFIRKMSIDELPQLFNVIRGEMSIVGPRPPIPSEVVKYERWQRRRLSMKPGLTCLWQVSGRNEVQFEDWMRLDLAYIDQWSLLLDFKIMARTVPVVLGASGQ